MRIVLLKVCVFILLANNLFSQERTQRDSLVQTLDSVLVIGQHESNKLSRAVPFLIGQQDNLINALDALPEIRKIHENGYPIVLRGMHGNRLRIENNGALRTGIVEQGYLLDDINPENIGRIETITGIESVISGSGSIGGIIRIESKKASEKRTGSIFLKAETNNGSRGIGLNLSNGLKALKYRLSARHFQTQNFQYGNREEATNSASNQLNLKLSTAYAKSEKLKLTWNNEYTQAEFQRPRGFQNNPNELRTFRNNYSFQSDLHIENKTKGMARLDHDIWYLAQDYDQLINNFNFDFSQLNVEENRNYQKQSAGYRVKLSSENSVNQEFLVGADAILNMLDERRRRNDLLNPSFSEEFLAERNEFFLGIFSLWKLQMGKITFGISLRGDLAIIGDGEQNVDFSALTGGIELKWNPNTQWQNQVSLTRKFRYPSHLEALGVFTGGRGLFFGNPDLTPEFGHQLEWSTTTFIADWEFNLSSWLTAFTDRISEIPIANNQFTYDNIALARTYGFEASIGRPVSLSEKKGLNMQLSSSFIRGDEIKENNGFLYIGTPLIGIPPLRLRLHSAYSQQITKYLNYSINLDIDKLSAFNRIPEGILRQTWAVQITEGYWLLNLESRINLKLKNNLMVINAGVTNLFNAIYYPFGARIMGMGRNYRIGLRFEF